MRHFARMAFSGLLTNLLALFVTTQPMMAQNCSSEPSQRIQLEHNQPVTLPYQPGQTVWLAGDASGTGELQGRSVVAVEFSPSSKGLGYSLPPETLPEQNVTELLESGENRVTLIAVDRRDVAWLVVTTLCTAEAPEMPTPIPATVTPVPTARAISSTILLPTVPVRPTLDHIGPAVDGTTAESEGQYNRIRSVLWLLFGLSVTVLAVGITLGLFPTLRRKMRK